MWEVVQRLAAQPHGPGGRRRTGTTPLDTLLVRQTHVNVAATTSVETAAAPAASKDKFVVEAVDPVVGINAVVATFHVDPGPERGGTDHVGADPGGCSRAPLDPQPQLPAGTFVALRALWKEYNK